MFLFMPLRPIHILVEKLQRAHKRAFPVWACLMWASQQFLEPLSATLRAGPFSVATDYYHHRLLVLILLLLSVLGWQWCWSCCSLNALYYIHWCRGGIDIVLPFRIMRSWGRSPGPASSNSVHPSASLVDISQHLVANCHCPNNYNKRNVFSLTCLTYSIIYHKYVTHSM